MRVGLCQQSMDWDLCQVINWFVVYFLEGKFCGQWMQWVALFCGTELEEEGKENE